MPAPFFRRESAHTRASVRAAPDSCFSDTTPFATALQTSSQGDGVTMLTEELQTLHDITSRLDAGGIEYMLTGSMALNCYTQPRMTRDLDLVVAFYLKDAARIEAILGSEYYVSVDAAREAVLRQGSFNAIHQSNLVKVDFMVRKAEEYRQFEFARRVRVRVADFEVWVVSKEDLILSKLDWARESLSQRQLADVENLIASGCDLDYVRAWSVKLNLIDMLTRVSP